MTQTAGAGVISDLEQSTPPTLDIVVPILSPVSAGVAFAAAARLGAGLDSTIRLLKIQVVPFPLQISEPPVVDGFLVSQLTELEVDVRDSNVHREILYTREFDVCLRNTITKRSLVVLASRRGFWRTREERLADALIRDGYSVILVPYQDIGAARLL
jgi:hypothetical protein